MACTTILVGKKASYDGSTMIARNDDSGSGHFTAKKFTVVHPEDLPKVYRSVLSHVEVPLPEGAMRFTAMPNAVEGKGIWAASGVNAANVGMTATETITSNPRVLGADPLVEYRPAKGGQPEVPGGIGEEDIVYLVLPYIHTAREGVQRLGQLLQNNPNWNKATALSLMLFVLLYSPCFVSLVVIQREAGGWRWLIFSMVFNTLLAFAVSVAAYQIGLVVWD